jgi:hypothetical protein
MRLCLRMGSTRLALTLARTGVTCSRSGVRKVAVCVMCGLLDEMCLATEEEDCCLDDHMS